MFKNTALYFMAVFALLFYSSCKKSCPYVEPLLIQEEMKAWTGFLPGSYWIYKDSISGKLDTISIYAFKYNLIESSNTEKSCPNKKQQEMNINIEPDTIYNPSNYEFFGIYDLDKEGELKGEVTFKKKDNRALTSPYILFPINVGDTLNYGSKSQYVTEEILSSLRVGDTTFNEVLCIHDNFNYVLRGESRFYHVKELGVVKKVVYKNDSTEPEQVWELVDWEVFQEE